MKLLIRILILLPVFSPNFPALSGQDHLERYGNMDVLSYRFTIELNDTTDRIGGQAILRVRFRKPSGEVRLDLVNADDKGLGMTLEQVLADGEPAVFRHENDQVFITAGGTSTGSVREYLIRYGGIPRDGLIISRNKFGDRTFFGDNWPDRARHWLPVVDHPSDKAYVEFEVSAPGHYMVVSNGTKVEETRARGSVVSRWKTDVPLPTKLMVIGVSPFSVHYFSSSSGIPVSSWVFPQDREAGFFDFGMAALPLDFFESYIGTYPFSKLANVQSKTVYGGMENAGCIFYHENAITGKRDQEQLIAHEIAHQWFGDAVTEGDWHHIWLSEGFATYLADLYLEERFGTDSMFSSLVEEREQVIRFTKMAFFPVIDTTRPVSVGLLNPNTYEKAAWFLHMLRSETGDSIFRECIRSFYRNFRYGNVLTEDFLSVVDSVSGKSYRSFFDQWLRIAGHPIISASWEQSGPEILLRIRQCQVHHVYSFPLDLQVVSGGVTEERTVYVDRAVQDFRIPFSREKADIRLDPGCRLLFEYCPEDQ